MTSTAAPPPPPEQPKGRTIRRVVMLGNRSGPPPLVLLTCGQNPAYRGERPYRHALFGFRLGSLGLTVWLNNTKGRGAYYEWRHWGLSLPRSPIWKMERYS